MQGVVTQAAGHSTRSAGSWDGSNQAYPGKVSCSAARLSKLVTLAALAFATVLAVPARAAEGINGDVAFASGDYFAALQDWLSAAAAGDASAMLSVGALYDTGHGATQDWKQALVWYRRAAEAGNASAMFNIAVMYDSGQGTVVDRAEAIRWYGMAAEKGNGRAAYDLGLIYRDGDGVPKDTAQAIHYFQIAAAAGIQAARPNLSALGSSATLGSSTVPKPVPATHPVSRPAPAAPPQTGQQVSEISRFQKVALERGETGGLSPRLLGILLPTLEQDARTGNGLAQYDLGYVYEHGLGVPTDLVQSYSSYLRAAASHDTTVIASALKGAAEVGDRLTPDQHAAAREILLGEH